MDLYKKIRLVMLFASTIFGLMAFILFKLDNESFFSASVVENFVTPFIIINIGLGFIVGNLLLFPSHIFRMWLLELASWYIPTLVIFLLVIPTAIDDGVVSLSGPTMNWLAYGKGFTSFLSILFLFFLTILVVHMPPVRDWRIFKA